ncbi:hypothetical protein LSTR_LSTR004288 [Laodelphax striatellus]|uniref:Uncharacterized protein n=1 Tax=Laodelphax striatellus TaxID=195883 RepID=A0A482WHA9_LAOST|nr:hypothetical protein LSTR_LSTR004288 [Laodelphax striatellus]
MLHDTVFRQSLIMKLNSLLVPILLFSIFLFAVGPSNASSAADDEAQMMAEMMEQLAEKAGPGRYERSFMYDRRWRPRNEHRNRWYGSWKKPRRSRKWYG